MISDATMGVVEERRKRRIIRRKKRRGSVNAPSVASWVLSATSVTVVNLQDLFMILSFRRMSWVKE
jgi:hypothetical protein